jgi:hypothetical protein
VITLMEETRVVGLQEFFMFPRCFSFGVIISLDLVEPSSLVAHDSFLLVNEGPEKATRGGVNGSQSKFLEGPDLYPEIDSTPLSSNSAKTA